MRDLCPEVKTALKTACSQVYYFYPDSFNKTPVMSYCDNGNAGDDGRDLLTRVSFKVDVWAKTVPELKQIVSAADQAMRGLGFRRTLSQPMPDPSGLRRQTMRFEGTYNALDRKIYSRS